LSKTPLTNFRAIIEEVDHLRESKVQGLLEGRGMGLHSRG
jgi:hypothetical protein